MQCSSCGRNIEPPGRQIVEAPVKIACAWRLACRHHCPRIVRETQRRANRFAAADVSLQHIKLPCHLQTPPGPSPARSPAQTPPGGQSQTPPCSRTPSVSGGGHPADGAAAAGGQQPHYSVPSPQPPQQLPPQQQYPGYDGSQQRSPLSASQQLQFGGTNGAVSGYGGGGPAANGTPPLHPQQQQPQQQPMQQPQQLQLPPQQQYYSPLQQQQSPPPNYSPNG